MLLLHAVRPVSTFGLLLSVKRFFAALRMTRTRVGCCLSATSSVSDLPAFVFARLPPICAQADGEGAACRLVVLPKTFPPTHRCPNSHTGVSRHPLICAQADEGR